MKSVRCEIIKLRKLERLFVNDEAAPQVMQVVESTPEVGESNQS